MLLWFPPYTKSNSSCGSSAYIYSWDGLLVALYFFDLHDFFLFQFVFFMLLTLVLTAILLRQYLYSHIKFDLFHITHSTSRCYPSHPPSQLLSFTLPTIHSFFFTIVYNSTISTKHILLLCTHIQFESLIFSIHLTWKIHTISIILSLYYFRPFSFLRNFFSFASTRIKLPTHGYRSSSETSFVYTKIEILHQQM